MIYKEDWDKTKERMSAWWQREIIDRAVIQVTAPRKRTGERSIWNEWDLVHNLTNPEMVVGRFQKYCEQTFFGGEAYPNIWINMGPGIMGAFLGAEPRIAVDTVWFETPKEWDELETAVRFDPVNRWWKTTQVTETCDGEFIVGMTDLGGNLDIAASLRGTQNLLIDLIESPGKVKDLMAKINPLWLTYHEQLNDILKKKTFGTTTWMQIWSPKNWYPLQCDFSAMISPKMFEEFVAPYLCEQCSWLDHTIYHWDGPGEIPHLDILLEIEELHGIQWTPGEGNPGVGSPNWFHLYKKIQQKGKLLVLLSMPPQDVESVMGELSPEGLLISTSCHSEDEARYLLKRMLQWTRRN
jgi:5-methyltetrahydrofolate--homocysteine methyltransferase